MEWILVCKLCIFGEYICYNSRDIEFFLACYFFGAPCMYVCQQGVGYHNACCRSTPSRHSVEFTYYASWSQSDIDVSYTGLENALIKSDDVILYIWLVWAPEQYAVLSSTGSLHLLLVLTCVTVTGKKVRCMVIKITRNSKKVLIF